ncbi:hypothetical protein GCM10011591_21800 [Nocardia camponoti]|uniref:Uncharacterized protein n=1 Tax=Nocardia camponoti TaxID=1616106 RepID=A0A917V8D6_9NOCA|nr:hypothetical protein GCM10011591_21800 [Nocardia camponoti]
MSEFNVDPTEMRSLARELRVHSGVLSGKQPIAQLGRDAARQKMIDSNLATKVEESLRGMDSVVRYHAKRMTEQADFLDAAATAIEQTDSASATSIARVGR